jgi:hypothetical protein
MVAALLSGCVKTVGPLPIADPATASGASSRDVLPDPLRSLPPLTRVPTVSSPARPSYPEVSAVACAGYPSAERIISLLRGASMISSTRVTVRTGPLCAGSWQYTVIAVAGREPLQVLTKGVPESLTLVTAGTDVCTPEVRAAAPAGILTLTHC